MILEDFTMLGTTVPEPNSDGRVFVCSAGISPELKALVRIYPLARKSIPRRWDTHRVALERNPKDSRGESFRVRGDRTIDRHGEINDQFTVTGRMSEASRAELLRPFEVDSIAQANSRKLSLAILKPDIGEMTFDFNPDSPESPQLSLFDSPNAPSSGAKRFPFIPRLQFRDADGNHKLMVRDWGCYEWMRKNPDRHEELPQCLRLTTDSALLVGNFNRHRTAWLIISVLNGLRAPSLFDSAVLCGGA